MNVEHLIGWKLDDAKAALSDDESTRALPMRVVETVAPLRKNQTEEEQAAKLGAWRVLRAGIVHGEAELTKVELTVAREQLVD